MASDQALQAHSWAEVQFYLMVTPCPACGKGPWRATPTDAPGPGAVDVAATCQACGEARTFRFAGAQPSPANSEQSPDDDPLARTELVNATDEPSRIIDVGQWLSLFYLFIEAASKETRKPVSRRVGYQAAQCLAEALRFYGDNELPSSGALFTEASRAAFRDHPERFARQRLRDMQAKLPSLSRMAQRIAQDRQHAAAVAAEVTRLRRPWWRFWQKRDR